jgi:hypothetical protein
VQNELKAKGLGCDSRVRALANAQSPEFQFVPLTKLEQQQQKEMVPKAHPLTSRK